MSKRLIDTSKTLDNHLVVITFDEEHPDYPMDFWRECGSHPQFLVNIDGGKPEPIRVGMVSWIVLNAHQEKVTRVREMISKNN